MLEERPLVKRTVKTTLNILIGLVTIVVATVVVSRLFVPIISSVIELNEAQLHAVSGLANLIFISLAYFIFVKYYEKRQAGELAFNGANIAYGAISGFAVISITTLTLFAMGYYELVTQQKWGEVLLVLIAFAAQVIVAELIIRGIFFRLIEQSAGTVSSLILVSLVYAGVNILNDGPNLIVFVSSALICALWCGIYILSRNLWVVGAHATGWLYAVFLTGILDEHWRVSAPFISSYNGPALMTGGEFGPDASIITIVVAAICLFLVLRFAKQRGRFI